MQLLPRSVWLLLVYPDQVKLAERSFPAVSCKGMKESWARTPLASEIPAPPAVRVALGETPTITLYRQPATAAVTALSWNSLG